MHETWIARLTGLRRLDLGYIFLQALPAWIGDLAELRELHVLHMADPPAELPESLGRLSRLTLLHFGLSVRIARIPQSVAELKQLSIRAMGVAWNGARRLWLPALTEGPDFIFTCPANMYNERRAREEERALELEDAE